MSARLIPPTTPVTEPYWQAAANGELKIQHCSDCGAIQFPPRANCASCGSDELRWEAVSGEGTIYTFTVAYRPPHPVFANQCPLVVAVVELKEGPRLMTNVVDCEPGDVNVGMPVQVTFLAIEDSDKLLPVFKPLLKTA